MSEGRTTYWAKDTAWWRRERIALLGGEFGPAGPAVIDWLSCEADHQRDRGRVKTGPRAIAIGCFLEGAQQARTIVERAVEIGALDDFEEHGLLFTVRVSGWEKDQQRESSARRQREKRERDRHGLSRVVTACHDDSHDARDPAQNGSTTDRPELAVVGAPGSVGVLVAGEAPVVTGDPAPLSRSVTGSNGRSRAVTRSHVKTRPVNNHFPPNPPPSGGRQRDNERLLEQYHQDLEAFLSEHPCSEDDLRLDAWRQMIEPLHDSPAAAYLDGSHPHEHSDDGPVLIGVHPQSLALANRFAIPDVERLAGRPVRFVACPSLELPRSAA